MKTQCTIFQREDKTINITYESRDTQIAQEHSDMFRELYKEDLYASDADSINLYMHYLRMTLKQFSRLSPNGKRFVSPFTGEALRATACNTDLFLIMIGAGGKLGKE